MTADSGGTPTSCCSQTRPTKPAPGACLSGPATALQPDRAARTTSWAAGNTKRETPADSSDGVDGASGDAVSRGLSLTTRTERTRFHEHSRDSEAFRHHGSGLAMGSRRHGRARRASSWRSRGGAVRGRRRVMQTAAFPASPEPGSVGPAAFVLRRRETQGVPSVPPHRNLNSSGYICGATHRPAGWGLRRSDVANFTRTHAAVAGMFQSCPSSTRLTLMAAWSSFGGLERVPVRKPSTPLAACSTSRRSAWTTP